MNNDKKTVDGTTNDKEPSTLDELLEVLSEDDLRNLAWGGKSTPRTVGSGHGRRV